jgi:hypothetical protein
MFNVVTGFSMIHNSLFSRELIPLEDLEMFGLLVRLVREGDSKRWGIQPLSNRYIMKRYGVSRHRASRAIKLLEKAGALEVVDRGSSTTPRRVQWLRPDRVTDRLHDRRSDRSNDRSEEAQEVEEREGATADPTAEATARATARATNYTNSNSNSNSNLNSLRVKELGLSTSLVKALEATGLETIDQLIVLSRSELLSRPRLGKKSLDAIETALAALKPSRSLRYEAPKKKASRGPSDDERAVSRIWGGTYSRVFGESYSWLEFASPAGADRRALARICSMSPSPREEDIADAFERYLSAIRDGQEVQWPSGANLANFADPRALQLRFSSRPVSKPSRASRTTCSNVPMFSYNNSEY